MKCVWLIELLGWNDICVKCIQAKRKQKNYREFPFSIVMTGRQMIKELKSRYPNEYGFVYYIGYLYKQNSNIIPVFVNYVRLIRYKEFLYIIICLYNE